MLVFGPYRSIPKDENFKVYNLTSLTEAVPRIPGLFVVPDFSNNPEIISDRDRFEKEFDYWYYNYLLNDQIACTSLMDILFSLYNGERVYICINDYEDGVSSIINESFMKFIRERYDISYSIINEPSDFEWVPKDGCDFDSVAGIVTFDSDKKQFCQVVEEARLMNGGPIYETE